VAKIGVASLGALSISVQNKRKTMSLPTKSNSWLVI
jgi:hypothetical protein